MLKTRLSDTPQLLGCKKVSTILTEGFHGRGCCPRSLAGDGFAGNYLLW